MEFLSFENATAPILGLQINNNNVLKRPLKLRVAIDSNSSTTWVDHGFPLTITEFGGSGCRWSYGVGTFLDLLKRHTTYRRKINFQAKNRI